MTKEISEYNDRLIATDKETGYILAGVIDNTLRDAESEIWHAHPVWFINGNPIVGYSKQRKGIRLMFHWPFEGLKLLVFQI